MSELRTLLGPPPWTLYVEVCQAARTGIGMAVIPDFPADRDPRDASSLQAPLSVACWDVVQVTATKLEIEGRPWPGGAGTAAELCQGLFRSALEPAAGDGALEGEVPWWGPRPFGTYCEHRFRVTDWRSQWFLSRPFEIGGYELPLIPDNHAHRNHHVTPWFLVADREPSLVFRPELPVLVLPWDWVGTRYNPEKVVPVAEALADKAHVRKFAESVTESVDEIGNAVFPGTDSGVYGKAISDKISTKLAGKPRWHANVWIRKDTRQVLSVGNANFHASGVPTNQLIELDAVYMKNGKRIVEGQVFNSDDVLDAFEVKTSYSGTISTAQLERYKEAMDQRNPIKAQTAKRLKAVGGALRVVPNERVVNKINIMSKLGKGVAVGGAVLAGVGCLCSTVNGAEEEKFSDLELVMRQYRASPNGTEKLNRGLDLLAAMHAWLETIVPGDMFRNFVLYGWAMRFADESWLNYE